MDRRKSTCPVTHPHAYLTGDGKWVIFNSNRDGFPHIYAAAVPEEMLAELSPTENHHAS